MLTAIVAAATVFSTPTPVPAQAEGPFWILCQWYVRSENKSYFTPAFQVDRQAYERAGQDASRSPGAISMQNDYDLVGGLQRVPIPAGIPADGTPACVEAYSFDVLVTWYHGRKSFVETDTYTLSSFRFTGHYAQFVLDRRALPN